MCHFNLLCHCFNHHHLFFFLSGLVTEIDVLKLLYYDMVVLISLYNLIIFALNILHLFVMYYSLRTI